MIFYDNNHFFADFLFWPILSLTESFLNYRRFCHKIVLGYDDAIREHQISELNRVHFPLNSNYNLLNLLLYKVRFFKERKAIAKILRKC